jgi:uncharacterized protein (TIGR00255 family)
MTGFAHTTFILTASSGERSSVSLQIKSLNSRFFEATIKLPPHLLHLETGLVKQYKTAFKRGHIYCSLYINNPNIFEGTIAPAFTIIDGYVQSIQNIKERYNLSETIKLDTILQLPNIFSKEEPTIGTTILDTIQHEITLLIQKVITDQEQEGKTIADDLSHRITIIKKEMSLITERAHIFVEECKQKVHATLQEIGADENLLANAQKNSLYTLLDKIDIHEEIARFTGHLENFIQILSSSDSEKGKRLDFTLQELGREINTITAKCSDQSISSHAINVKVEIEKMREQIQNVV